MRERRESHPSPQAFPGLDPQNLGPPARPVIDTSVKSNQASGSSVTFWPNRRHRAEEEEDREEDDNEDETSELPEEPSFSSSESAGIPGSPSSSEFADLPESPAKSTGKFQEDFLLDSLSPPLPQPRPRKPAGGTEQPKPKNLVVELQIASLQHKIAWLERVVVHGEEFAVPELPEADGSIQFTDALTTSNLLSVLRFEPETCKLENDLKSKLLQVAVHQTYIGIMGDDIVPEVTKSIQVLADDVLAMRTQFASLPQTMCYVEIEALASADIAAEEQQSLDRYMQSVQARHDTLDKMIPELRHDMTLVLPKIRRYLQKLENGEPLVISDDDEQED
jgi:hypothetical protein